MKMFRQILLLFAFFYFTYCIRRHDMVYDQEFNYDCHPFGSVPAMAVISPRNIIYLEVGHPFTAFCHLNPFFNLSSDKIYFTKGLGNEEGVIETTIVDNYTIKTNIINAQPVSDFLFCRSVEQVLCVREISIGYPPMNVLDFHCVSFNWHLLTCAYNLPVNPVQRKEDDYFVSYTTEDDESEQTGYKCPASTNNSCCPLKGEECWVWGTSAYYPYEKFSQFLFIKIFSNNSLGKKSYVYKINQYEIMIPRNVKKLRAFPISARKIKIEFELPEFLSLFPPGIIYKVKASSLWDEKFLMGALHNMSKAEITVDVPWPGHQYKIDVLLRSGNKSWDFKEGNDGWWSKSYTHDVIVTTPLVSPWTAPDVTPGIFQTIAINVKRETRRIIVVWKRMEEFLYGGKNFKFNLEVYLWDEKVDVTPLIVTETFAIFENLSSKDSYRFLIRPENEVGISNSSAEVVVDAEEEIEGKELFFPLILHHARERTIEFEWFTDEDNIQNFTLFWCDDGSPDLGSPCIVY